MLSFNECKKILNENGILYSDDEVIQVKELLYVLVEIIEKSKK